MSRAVALVTDTHAQNSWANSMSSFKVALRNPPLTADLSGRQTANLGEPPEFGNFLLSSTAVRCVAENSPLTAWETFTELTNVASTLGESRGTL